MSCFDHLRAINLSESHCTSHLSSCKVFVCHTLAGIGRKAFEPTLTASRCAAACTSNPNHDSSQVPLTYHTTLSANQHNSKACVLIKLPVHRFFETMTWVYNPFANRKVYTQMTCTPPECPEGHLVPLQRFRTSCVVWAHEQPPTVVSPSLPASRFLPPQLYTWPADVTASACSRPAATAVTFTPSSPITC